MGADYTINYKSTPDFDAVVMKITNGKGCQIIADPVGAQNALKNIACCSVDARWVLFGFLGGSKLQNFDLGPLLAKRI